MYNSLPWEEDITRVYKLKPGGISCSEGFPLATVGAHVGVYGPCECENKM